MHIVNLCSVLRIRFFITLLLTHENRIRICYNITTTVEGRFETNITLHKKSRQSLRPPQDVSEEIFFEI